LCWHKNPEQTLLHTPQCQHAKNFLEDTNITESLEFTMNLITTRSDPQQQHNYFPSQIWNNVTLLLSRNTQTINFNTKKQLFCLLPDVSNGIDLNTNPHCGLLKVMTLSLHENPWIWGLTNPVTVLTDSTILTFRYSGLQRSPSKQFPPAATHEFQCCCCQSKFQKSFHCKQFIMAIITFWISSTASKYDPLKLSRA
jgi:hypothetical protein